MPSYNKVIVVGHLCADVEIRQAGGTQVGSLRLAIDDSYKTKSGEKVDRTVFVDAEVWDKQAEQCQRFVGKGSAVLVEGKLQMDEWEDKASGQKRTKLKVRAERVQFLTYKNGKDEPVKQSPSKPDDPEDKIPF
jgi:single-strand DNA-binding protein